MPSATDVTNTLSSLPPSPFVSITYSISPSEPLLLGTPIRLENSILQFTFTNSPSVSFSLRATTNLALPITEWVNLGYPQENPAGVYQFNDAEATNAPMRFYSITSP
ncbi:MAG TPA: hypothetical protein PKE26_00510 [Kiritimatiellia bacterium]|nr:hypothetical protein [Kiritimatiellia bacterium]HMO97574.1 hypothetical protein [Kiritimatiellia bacterium]HMP96771.1 hypothetical protein [Kiritimatiellia bacterium]